MLCNLHSCPSGCDVCCNLPYNTQTGQMAVHHWDAATGRLDICLLQHALPYTDWLEGCRLFCCCYRQTGYMQYALQYSDWLDGCPSFYCCYHMIMLGPKYDMICTYIPLTNNHIQGYGMSSTGSPTSPLPRPAQWSMLGLIIMELMGSRSWTCSPGTVS